MDVAPGGGFYAQLNVQIIKAQNLPGPTVSEVSKTVYRMVVVRAGREHRELLISEQSSAHCPGCMNSRHQQCAYSGVNCVIHVQIEEGRPHAECSHYSENTQNTQNKTSLGLR